jgi:hypothetical protein
MRELLMFRTTLSAVTVSLSLAVGLAPAVAKPVPLTVAVKTGLVEVEVTGRGSCSGDAVRVEVRRKVDRPVQVVVESGTVMESVSGDVQGMVCHGIKYEQVGDKYRRVDVMKLDDDRPHCFLLEAFCRDFPKPTPRADSSFRLGATDQGTSRVIVKGKAAGAGIRAIQAAVWVHAGVSDEQLRRNFNASATEIQVAHRVVAAARAAEQEDTAAERTADESVTVVVEDLVRNLLRRRRELPYVRGDTVEVTVENAPIQIGRRTIGTAKKGEHFMVLAVSRNDVRVVFVPDENSPPKRGWLSFDYVRLAEGVQRGEGRPLLRRLGELVSEEHLEVITAIDRGR